MYNDITEVSAIKPRIRKLIGLLYYYMLFNREKRMRKTQITLISPMG